MQKNPFLKSGSNEVDFPYTPMRDLVFVLPEEAPSMVGSFYIPESARDPFKQEKGIVLAVGKGYIDKTGKFIETKVKVGDIVVYDAGIPWEMPVKDKDGNEHQVKFMGALDIQGIIN